MSAGEDIPCVSLDRGHRSEHAMEGDVRIWGAGRHVAGEDWVVG